VLLLTPIHIYRTLVMYILSNQYDLAVITDCIARIATRFQVTGTVDQQGCYRGYTSKSSAVFNLHCLVDRSCYPYSRLAFDLSLTAHLDVESSVTIDTSSAGHGVDPSSMPHAEQAIHTDC